MDSEYGEITFDGFLQLADAKNYSTTDKGLSILYDVFKHLAEGGTVASIPQSNGEADSPVDVMGMLAVAWLDIRTLNLLKAETNEEF